MYIQFQSSGGFADPGLRLTIDVAELEPDAAAELVALVDASGFMNIQASDVVQTPTLLPDVTAFFLRIEKDGRVNSLSVTDTTAPPALRPLLQHLHQLATSQR